MIKKEDKKVILADLVERFKVSSGYYFVDFKGMNVQEAIRIRREMKKTGIGYKVAKNTLIRKALTELNISVVPDKVFKGETAIAFGIDDPIEPAKVIKELFDKYEKPVFKAAVLEGLYYDSSKLNTIASLPNKQDMMSSIVGSLHAPISGIVGSINAVLRDVASLVEEVAKKNNPA